MKTSVKLVVIYLLIQLACSLLAGPIMVAYVMLSGGDLKAMEANAMEVVLAPVMLISMAFMLLYLWKGGFLKKMGPEAWNPVSASYLAWTLVASAGLIFLIEFVMSWLDFLPNLMENTFVTMSGNWLGILCIAVIGPVLEELLFRGAVTRMLLKQYSPVKAIVISGLIFGIFHINPAQVVSACLSGFFFAWLYWRTRSLVPGIVLRILNNSLSVWMMANYPDVDTMAQLLGQPEYTICLVASVAVFAGAVFMLKRRPVEAVPAETVGACAIPVPENAEKEK